MALKSFHLIKDRFLFDDYESGLYFDLAPVKRPAGDENVFNGAIDEADEKLHSAETNPANQLWYCTLFLTEAQMYSLSAKYQNQFAAKSFLLLFKAGFDGKTMPTNPWFQIQSGGMVCNPTGNKSQWVYYTDYAQNNLSHRFRIVKKDEVDAYVDPNAVTPPPPPPDTGGDTDVPPVVTGDGFVHVRCPYCLKTIF
jgi:hypothetical protein